MKSSFFILLLCIKKKTRLSRVLLIAPDMRIIWKPNQIKEPRKSEATNCKI